MTYKELRNKFESIYAKEPFKGNLAKWSDKENPWPGSYKNIETQIAWVAFQEGYYLHEGEQKSSPSFC